MQDSETAGRQGELEDLVTGGKSMWALAQI